MIELHWMLSKARIWLGELPDWNYEEDILIQRVQGIAKMNVSDVQYAAVELYLPRGGRALYGGLGATFEPKSDGLFCVQVVPSLENGVLYAEALASSRMDSVHKGLPNQYVEGIFAGVAQADGHQCLGSGILRFAWATHGEIGSSLWIFQKLSRIIVRLMCLEKENISQETLLALIQEKP